MMKNRLPARGGARVGHWCRGVVALGLALAAAAMSRPARACSPGNPTAVAPTALPRTGSTEVPTATSFVILSGAPPVDVTLMAGGVAVPLGPLTPLGPGEGDLEGQTTSFWRVKPSATFLPPSADLVLSAADGNGGRVVLTSVHTAAGYDKQAGTPANIKSLTLTRIRYPIAEINSGDCVFAEFMGFLTFDADAAVIPGTAPPSVFNTISLAPRYGGAATQSRGFTGARPYTGDRVGAVQSGLGWMPFLDPTLEYCASITSSGYGDLARLPLVSNVVCARVQEISMPGARDDADAGTKADGGWIGAPSGGSDAGVDATGSKGDGAVAGDHDASSGADRHVAVGDGPPSCAVGGGSVRVSPIALVLLAGLLRRRRRR
jgi:hypothetical protein